MTTDEVAKGGTFGATEAGLELRDPAVRLGGIGRRLPGGDHACEIPHERLHLCRLESTMGDLGFKPRRIELIVELVGCALRVRAQSLHGTLQLAKHQPQRIVTAVCHMSRDGVPVGPLCNLAYGLVERRR